MTTKVLDGRMTPDYRKRKGVNDEIYTTDELAKRIIDYFTPQFKTGDKLLEPCYGQGAFYNNFPFGHEKDYCEIAMGKDFLEYNQPCNWIITNFPWSGKALRPMLRHASKLSENVVHLIRLHNILGTFARQRDFLEQNHSIKEIIIMDWKDAFHNKAQEGFCLMVIHTRKNYIGDCKWTYWIK